MNFLEPLCTLSPQLSSYLIYLRADISRGCKDQLAHSAGPGPPDFVMLVEEAQTLLECLQAYPRKADQSETT